MINRKNRKGAWGLLANKNLVVLIALVVAVALIFNSFNPASLLRVGDNPLEQKQFTFAGEQGIAEAPIFGSITNNPGFDFCGNDGDVSISNSLTGNNPLTISSSMSAGRSCKSNGVQGEVQVNPGKLKVQCSISASSGEEVSQERERANGECIVKINGQVVYNLFISSLKDGGSNKGSNLKEIIIENPSTLKFEVLSNGVTGLSTSGSASATLIMAFEELTEEEVQEVIEEIEGTSPDITTPETQPVIIERNFFQKIWDFIVGLFKR